MWNNGNNPAATLVKSSCVAQQLQHLFSRDCNYTCSRIANSDKKTKGAKVHSCKTLISYHIVATASIAAIDNTKYTWSYNWSHIKTRD